MKKIIIGILMSTLMILGINNVYADTIGWSSKSSRIYYDDHGTERNYNFLSMPRTHTADYPITQMEYRLSYSGGFSAGNTYTFSVEYTPNPDTLYATGLWFSDGTNRFTDVNCSGWSRNNNGTYSNMCAVSPVVDISSSGYMYVRIVYASSYVDSLTSGISNFSITKGTGAIIQESAIDIMNNQKELLTNQCSNEWNYTNYDTSNISNLNVNNSYDISYTTNGTSPKLSKDLNLTPNTTYNLSLNYEANNTTTYMIGLWCIDNNGGWSEIFSKTFTGTSGVFTRNFTTSSTNCSHYRYEFNNRNVNTTTNVSYKNIMLSKKNASYCIYGSYNNKIDELNNTLNQDTTYNNNSSENLTQEKNKMNEYKNKEETLMNSLDFSQVDDLNITINPNASSFIWEIVNRLRGMNGAIVLLMTSILGLGIVKMILNR